MCVCGARASPIARLAHTARLTHQVLALGGASGPALAAALRREATLQASLAHEHVVRVYGLAEGAGDKFGLVMARMHSDLQVRLLLCEGGAGRSCHPCAHALRGSRLEPSTELHSDLQVRHR